MKWSNSQVDHEWPEPPRGDDFNTGDRLEEDAEDVAVAEQRLADESDIAAPFRPAAE